MFSSCFFNILEHKENNICSAHWNQIAYLLLEVIVLWAVLGPAKKP